MTLMEFGQWVSSRKSIADKNLEKAHLNLAVAILDWCAIRGDFSGLTMQRLWFKHGVDIHCVDINNADDVNALSDKIRNQC